MDSRTPTIGLLTDPGTSADVAAKIADDVAERLSQQRDEQWHVEVSRETLPLSPDGTVQLPEHAPRLRRDHEWDIIVYFSDLPRYVDHQPMLAQVSTEARTALLIMPAVGGIRLATRSRDLVLALVSAIREDEVAEDGSGTSALGGEVVRSRPSSDGSGQTRLVLTGRLRLLQLLAGMVRANRPGTLLSALTGCIAAAIAAGAFGVFYGTLAPVADPLTLWHLGVISLLVISTLTTWLIVRNKLWNSEKGQDEIWRPGLDNVSTMITVGVSVLLLHAGLVAVMLVMALVVLSPSYLRGELLHEVGALEYLKVAWLSASMGAMAGSLGANFDQEDAVREATFSRRYHERRKLFDTYESEQEES